jgi:uncharacterized membrane protein
MRVKTKVSWGIYSVALAWSLYTFLFSALVAIGQGIYVLAIESFRLSKRVTAYVLASIAGIILFALIVSTEYCLSAICSIIKCG